MNYVNDTVRRQDRLLDEERAREILLSAEYGVLSMIDADGTPYGIPVNFVWDGADTFYIHTAPEGYKLKALALHPAVSLCVVGHVALQPSLFTTEYESIILRGTARVLTDEDEMLHALHMIVDKFSPNDKALGYKYCLKSFHRVKVIRLDMTEYSGKRKRLHPVKP